MRRKDREVTDLKLIEEMLKMIRVVNVAMNDTDGVPYIVALNYGFEIGEGKLTVYTHFAKQGKKINLFLRDPHVCLAFNVWNDFPTKRFGSLHHDYRSVIAKGTMHFVAYEDDPELWERAYNSMYSCNGRAIKPLSERKVVPPIYMGVITCELSDVTAKSEYPLKTVEDVPFKTEEELEQLFGVKLD